jgi:predicted nuclease of predicted toxin-antitoxin system
MKPRFLLDEHINRAIQRQLRRLDPHIDVLAIGDLGAPQAGTPDPDILDWLEANGYILVTENRRTMPLHLTEHWAAGRHIPGIFWIRPNVGIGRVIEELYLIWAASTGEEYQDRALYIPL